MAKTFLAVATDSNGVEHHIDIPESVGCETQEDAANHLLVGGYQYNTEGHLIMLTPGHTVSIIIQEI